MVLNGIVQSHREEMAIIQQFLDQLRIFLVQMITQGYPFVPCDFLNGITQPLDEKLL